MANLLKIIVISINQVLTIFKEGLYNDFRTVFEYRRAHRVPYILTEITIP